MDIIVYGAGTYCGYLLETVKKYKGGGECGWHSRRSY